MIPKEFENKHSDPIQPHAALQPCGELQTATQFTRLTTSFVCYDCDRKISANITMMVLLKHSKSVKPYCSRCLDRHLLLKHVWFYEQYHDYIKRMKTGQIDQMIQEYLKHEKNKRHSIT